MKLELIYDPKHNSVYIAPENDNTKIANRIWNVFDKIGDDFPPLTKKWTDDNHTSTLTIEQQNKLCKMAEKIIRRVLPSAVVAFKYDFTSG
mgnify:CR=1 FL=1